MLAVNDLGTGSGWQQSKQNWALAAVVGQRIRMARQWPLQCRSCTTPPLCSYIRKTKYCWEDLTSESALAALTPNNTNCVMRHAYTCVMSCLGPVSACSMMTTRQQPPSKQIACTFWARMPCQPQGKHQLAQCYGICSAPTILHIALPICRHDRTNSTKQVATQRKR